MWTASHHYYMDKVGVVWKRVTGVDSQSSLLYGQGGCGLEKSDRCGQPVIITMWTLRVWFDRC